MLPPALGGVRASSVRRGLWLHVGLIVREAQAMPDARRRFRAIERIEVQAWRAAAQKIFGLARGDLDAELLLAERVTFERLHALPNPRRDVRAAELREPRDLPEVGERHDAGHDRNLDAEAAHPVEKPVIRVVAIEVLRDRFRGAGAYLAHEVVDVGVGARRFRMELGI